MNCRYCGSEGTHKSGKNFLETDEQIKASTKTKRVLAVCRTSLFMLNVSLKLLFVLFFLSILLLLQSLNPFV